MGSLARGVLAANAVLIAWLIAFALAAPAGAIGVDGLNLPVPATVVYGGTGVSSCTAHGLIMGEGSSAFACSAAGSSGQAFVSGGAGGDGAYATLGVAGGGTGQTSLTNHGVLVGAATSGVTQLSVGATNSVLQGSTGADPSFTTTPTLASLTTTGNAQIQGNRVQGSGTNSDIYFNDVSVNNNANAQATQNAVGTGLFVLSTPANHTCLFTLAGANHATTLLVADAQCSVTAGNANTLNVYWSAGNSRYEMENKTGGALEMITTFIGTSS